MGNQPLTKLSTDSTDNRKYLALTACSEEDVARYVAPQISAICPEYGAALSKGGSVKMNGMEVATMVTASIVAASPLGSIDGGDRNKQSKLAHEIRKLRKMNILSLNQRSQLRWVEFPSSNNLRLKAEDPNAAYSVMQVSSQPLLQSRQLEIGVDLPTGDQPCPEGHLRVVCISDTHGFHEKMVHSIPDGDVLIHAGDFSNTGRMKGCSRFCEWFASMPHQHKILIAGNRKSHSTFTCHLCKHLLKEYVLTFLSPLTKPRRYDYAQRIL